MAHHSDKCRACGNPFEDGGPFSLCNTCYARLEHGAKMRSKVLTQEIKRIRDHRFTDEEVNYYLASVLRRQANDALDLLGKSVRTREVSKEAGLPRFYTGMKCLNGHDSERFVVNGKCVQCCLDMHKRIREKKIKTGRPGILQRLSSSQRENMKIAILSGTGNSEIGRQFGCHRNTVINLKREMQ